MSISVKDKAAQVHGKHDRKQPQGEKKLCNKNNSDSIINDKGMCSCLWRIGIFLISRKGVVMGR